MQPWLRSERATNEPWPGAHIPRREWIRAWATVAANSFGGPAGQISVMHEEIVERRGWISERRFLHALNYCMLLPGPEAQQLATYLGWLLRGPMGGLFAGVVFILPGFVSIMALSILFAAYGDVGWVEGLFFGITAAVVVIVAAAVRRIGGRVITNPVMAVVAGAAFVAVFVFELPFPAVVAAAVVVGIVGGRQAPGYFLVVAGHDAGVPESRPEALVGDTDLALAAPSARRAARVLAVGLGLWFLPIAGLIVFGVGAIYVDIGWFFSSAAVLTFGGAYSVLAYISQEAVNTYGWLEPGEMLSGLGMAETTPGPLIQVVQFVGFMGPYREPGGVDPLAAGFGGAVVATWVTFVPSFLWIFLGAPFIESLRGRASLTAALSTVTAAVVGVVLNLAVWFAVFTLFDEVQTSRRFGAVLYRPDLQSLDWAALVIAAVAAVAVFGRGLSALRVVMIAAVLGVAHQLLIV